MQVYFDNNDFKKLKNAIVTTGTFDGVHKGHQKILARLNELCKHKQAESVVITYWPHPRKVLSNGAISPKILHTLQERINRLKDFNIDHLIIVNFTKEFAEITSELYLKDFLAEKIGTKVLIIGYDHRFGKNREGGFDYLLENSEKYGFEVEEIPREDIDSIAISSTKIREALADGDIENANKYLGQQFILTGKVVQGNQKGRTIGFPTANLSIVDPDKIIPKDGVYAVFVEIDQQLYKGMLNIGFRPTLNGKERSIEVNIFDFNSDIYGKNIRLRFVKYLREEFKFSGIDTLKKQLNNDKLVAMQILL